MRRDFPKPAGRRAELTPYKVSESAKLTLQEKQGYLKLDWNEAPFPPSPVVKERLREAVEADVLNFYPDVTANELRDKLSAYVGLDASHIQVFNGSDSALQNICITYLDDKDGALVREPTYTQFGVFAQSVGANLIKFTGDTPFSLALDKYHEYLSSRDIKLAYIVNPNNPTGVTYQHWLIRRELLHQYPETLFVIDEAYFEYSGITAIDLVRKHPNILITRSFSKAFGLAGLRIGYVIGLPQLIDDLSKARNGKDVNTLAQIAASAALDDIPYMTSRVLEVIRTRKWLANELEKLGVEVYEAPANYILMRFPDAASVIQGLREEEILVRDRSYLPQLDGCIRVSVGLPYQMQYFLEAICRVFQ